MRCTGHFRRWAASSTPIPPTRCVCAGPAGSARLRHDPRRLLLRPGACTRELTPAEIEEDYELNTGKVIIETFRERGIDPVHLPAVLCASHGPFTWGKTAAEAVYHAAVLEEVAKMGILTLTLDPNAEPAPRHVLDKHFLRKHGPNAYYGQG